MKYENAEEAQQIIKKIQKIEVLIDMLDGTPKFEINDINCRKTTIDCYGYQEENPDVSIARAGQKAMQDEANRLIDALKKELVAL